MTQIPPALIGTAGPILDAHYTHAELNALFMQAGFPGDPPQGNKTHKCLSWMRRANAECSDPLMLFGVLIAELMDGEALMKIQLLRASKIVKEIEFAATMAPLDIQRLSVDLMFENFERNETHLWPRDEDTRGARHEIQVVADDGSLLRTFDIREITKETCLKFLGRRVDITG
jgi:hypothetical protein